ncbi:30S ribosomal protein S4e [Candidatus Micrarchaeota archaeon]|nr:30S ribosomal protein S4e [Candidatus Micrarchaeota archaeon]
MAKLGGTKHVKRLATPKAVPITDKKESTWILRTFPGPHPKRASIGLGVLLRDVLKVAPTLKEVKQILNRQSPRLVRVDHRPRTDVRFPVGLMDVVRFDTADKFYRIIVDSKGRLIPVEIKKAEADSKLLKVVGKNVLKGGKISLALHDGRNLFADNHINVGDSIVFSLNDGKLKSTIKLAPGAKCLISEGKHAGAVVTLKEIVNRQAGKPSEALVSNESGDFITVAKYLFAVDGSFKTSG